MRCLSQNAARFEAEMGSKSKPAAYGKGICPFESLTLGMGVRGGMCGIGYKWRFLHCKISVVEGESVPTFSFHDSISIARHFRSVLNLPIDANITAVWCKACWTAAQDTSVNLTPLLADCSFLHQHTGDNCSGRMRELGK